MAERILKMGKYLTQLWQTWGLSFDWATL